MRQASTYVPINQLNLPEGYHRADLINPASIYRGLTKPLTPQELQQLTNSSSMEEALANYALSHSQGAQNVARNQTKTPQQRPPQLVNDPISEHEVGVGVGVQQVGEPRTSPEPQDIINESPQPSPGLHEGNGDENVVSDDYRLSQLILNHQALQKAYVPLNYDEGYPMTPEGQPFWQKLPCEPIDAYLAFQGYLEQGTSGGRQLFVLSSNINLQQRIAALRTQRTEHTHAVKAQEAQGYPYRPNITSSPLEGSGFIPSSTNLLDSNSECLHGASHDEFVEWFYLYHWDWRARSHDLFYVESIRKSREMLALQLENTHFSDSAKLYSKLLAFINPDPSNPEFKPYFLDGEGEPLFWKNLTSKTALEALKLVTQLQRISIGLNPATITPQRSLVSGDSPGKQSGQSGQNIAYLSSPSKRAGPGTDQQTPNDQPSEALSSQDRARRLAILLDRARSRKAG